MFSVIDSKKTERKSFERFIHVCKKRVAGAHTTSTVTTPTTWK